MKRKGDIRALVLASGSPRRVALLREHGFGDFEVRAPEVEEAHDEGLTPEVLTLSNARLKAGAVAAQRPEAVVVAADTLVYVDGVPLGKPLDRVEARAMLERLAGRAHQVCTGVVIAWAGGLEEEAFAVVTDVVFKSLSPEVMAAYHAVCDPLDKAGGYGIQDGTEMILERIAGSFSNVMGLPMEELGPRLRRVLGAEAALTGE
jgi:septum formation protein